MTLALLGAMCLFAAEPEPVVRAWVLNPAYSGSPPSLRAALPDVHEVRVDAESVHVTSAGLSLHSLGALEANQYEAPSGVRPLAFDIPRHPRPAALHVNIPLGIIGVFVTGVPIYNPIGAASWQDQNLWHRDAVAMSRAPSPLLDRLKTDTGRHSPLIGFALDGFPIYGPFGWNDAGQVKRVRSGYQLRVITERRVWPDGTVLAPGQEGQSVSADAPLGTFAEDYEYVPGSGDLDQFNGRFAKTPEYPEGTYAYYLTAWPYLVGPQFYGEVPAIAQHPLGLSHNQSGVRAGEPIQLVFNLGARFLEKVHEQPIHLAIVSQDLKDFAHIHPQPIPGDAFAVTHTFGRRGDYWLYANYTPPGGAMRVERFKLTVEGTHGEPRPVPPATDLNVRLTVEGAARAGSDVPLRFELSDAATGKPIEDLQPWLGAWGHVMIVSQDGSEFIHAHPQEAAGGVHTHSLADLGPSPATIRTVTGFAKPGIYKLWFQCQRNGTVETFPFTLKVASSPISPAKRAAVPSGAATVRVTSAGFQPSRLSLPAGTAARIAFTRTDARGCAQEVVFPELGIRQALPLGQTVLVSLPASAPRELHFACGMGMLRGSLVVK